MTYFDIFNTFLLGFDNKLLGFRIYSQNLTVIIVFYFDCFLLRLTVISTPRRFTLSDSKNLHP